MVSDLRSGAILFADIAAATELRACVGDREADALLDPIIAALTVIVEQQGGQVIKSDGDDVLAVFDHRLSFVEDCALAAIECQHEARRHGRSLYAGMHAGLIEFREVLGRPDVAGMAVNLAARLHKLVPDLPGHIFLAAESVEALSAPLRERMRPYGTRPIKGVGPVEVYTLDWDEEVTVVPTRFAATAILATPVRKLSLRHGDRVLRLAPGKPPFHVGRNHGCELYIEDEQQRVSSRHLKIHCRSGAWYMQDISRNGTWLKTDGSPNEISLRGEEFKLIGSGRLCLGRPFAGDTEGRFTVRFELERA